MQLQKSADRADQLHMDMDAHSLIWYNFTNTDYRVRECFLWVNWMERWR